MTYAFTQDVPANAEIYARIKELLPADPKGLVAHLAFEREGGLRYVDVWETEADWAAFRDEHVEPSVGKVLAEIGLPHDHSAVTSQTLTAVDVWIP